MANKKHVELLKRGVEAWNKWRDENPEEVPDLKWANLSGACLVGANLREAHLFEANLCEADLRESTLNKAILAWAKLKGTDLRGADLGRATLNYVNFSSADLSRANLKRGDLFRAILVGANLSGANLSEANLSGANLSGANLGGAILEKATLVQSKLNAAKLAGCRIYGTSVWDVSFDEETSQRDLIITASTLETVTVDDLEVAQFIYLLLNNKKIRSVIDTITSKIVLILGRFTDERKQVLDKLRDELRQRDYLPVLFDFDKPDSRDLTETISTLAHMARFVIADITDAKAVPQELQKIVPNLPSLPVRPIILDTQYEYGMFKDFGGYLSVLPPFRYQNAQHLLESLEVEVIGPALTKAEEISERRKAFEAELAKRQ